MNSKVLFSALVTGGMFVAMAVGPILSTDASANGFGYGYGYKPGWGFGDQNHIHTGPPGQMKKDGESSHPHGGPPGQTKKNAPEEPEEIEEESILIEIEPEEDASTEAPGNGKGRDNAPGQIKKQDSEPQQSQESDAVEEEDDEPADEPGKGKGKSGHPHGGPPGQAKKNR